MKTACVAVRARDEHGALQRPYDTSCPLPHRAQESEVPGFPAVFEYRSEPNFVRIEKSPQLVLHLAWERSVLGRQHTAQAHPVFSHDRVVQAHIPSKLLAGLGRLPIDRCDGPGDITSLPRGHDAWVIGDEPAIVVDWFGASNYAKQL